MFVIMILTKKDSAVMVKSFFYYSLPPSTDFGYLRIGVFRFPLCLVVIGDFAPF